MTNVCISSCINAFTLIFQNRVSDILSLFKYYNVNYLNYIGIKMKNCELKLLLSQIPISSILIKKYFLAGNASGHV